MPHADARHAVRLEVTREALRGRQSRLAPAVEAAHSPPVPFLEAEGKRSQRLVVVKVALKAGVVRADDGHLVRARPALRRMAEPILDGDVHHRGRKSRQPAACSTAEAPRQAVLAPQREADARHRHNFGSRAADDRDPLPAAWHGHDDQHLVPAPHEMRYESIERERDTVQVAVI